MLFLMILNIYEINFEEINIKIRIYNYYFDNLIKAKKLETIWSFTRYDRRKSIRILSLDYHELVERLRNAMEKIF